MKVKNVMKRIYIVPREFIPRKMPFALTLALICTVKVFNLPTWCCILISIFLFVLWTTALDRMLREQPLWEEEIDLKELTNRLNKIKNNEADTVQGTE